MENLRPNITSLLDNKELLAPVVPTLTKSKIFLCVEMITTAVEKWRTRCIASSHTMLHAHPVPWWKYIGEPKFPSIAKLV